jgi:PAS domain S-box-containing protein
MLFGIRWRGLQAKIITWSFVPAAIILSAVALVGFYAYDQVTEDLVMQRDQEVVRLYAGKLASELSEYTDDLAGLAHILEIPNTPDAQRALLKTAANRLVIFDGGAILLDNYGTVIAAEPERPAILGQEWSDRAYFRQMVRAPGPLFSDVVWDGPDGAAVVAAAVPLLGPQGEFRGMAVGFFRLGAGAASGLYGSIVKLRMADGETAFLVDQKGRVIYHSDGARIGEVFAQQDAVQRVANGDSGALRTREVPRRETVAAFAPVPGTPWGLVTEVSLDQLTAPSAGYRRFLLLLLALGVLIPAAVVAIGARRLTRPITDLISAAREVAGGSFGRTIEPTTNDELATLVRQFNVMSAQLSRSYSELQTRQEQLDLVMQGTNDGIWDWDIRTGEVYFSPRWKGMLGYADPEIPNRFDEWRRLMHPDDAARTMETVEAYLRGRNPTYQVEHRLQHKDGTFRWILARGIALRNAEGLPYRMVGSHTDITESKRIEEALQRAYQTLEQRVEERTHELATLNAIAAVVSQSLDLKTVLSAALDRMLAIMNLGCGGAYRLEGENTDSAASPHLNPLVFRGVSDEFVRTAEPFPLANSAVAVAYAQSAPLVWDVTDSMIERPALDRLAHEGIGQVISVPLVAKGRLVGAIQLGAETPRAYESEQLSLLWGIGQQVGMAVENARLYQHAEAAAALAERNRLARDLHDSVTQSLYSVTLYAEAAARLLSAGEMPRAAEHLRSLRDTAQEALREMRLLIFELRPPTLEKTTLAEAIQGRLKAVEGRGGIQAELRVSGAEHLPLIARQELYQIAHEALNNVLRHAQAQRVDVDLEFSDAGVQLRITDDGVGFEPHTLRERGGMGLSGIRERAQRIGGTLQIESAPGRGTKLAVRVPAVPHPHPGAAP